MKCFIKACIEFDSNFFIFSSCLFIHREQKKKSARICVSLSKANVKFSWFSNHFFRFSVSWALASSSPYFNLTKLFSIRTTKKIIIQKSDLRSRETNKINSIDMLFCFQSFGSFFSFLFLLWAARKQLSAERKRRKHHRKYVRSTKLYMIVSFFIMRSFRWGPGFVLRGRVRWKTIIIIFLFEGIFFHHPRLEGKKRSWTKFLTI